MRSAVVAGLLLSVVCMLPSVATASPTPLRLAQTPYVGVSCPTANVTSCGRVGVAIWLTRHGASDVIVYLSGVHARLGPPPRRSPVPSWRTFVHLPLAAMGIPAHWYGRPSKTLTLRVLARYGGIWFSRTVVVALRTGWA